MEDAIKQALEVVKKEGPAVGGLVGEAIKNGLKPNFGCKKPEKKNDKLVGNQKGFVIQREQEIPIKKSNEEVPQENFDSIKAPSEEQVIKPKEQKNKKSWFGRGTWTGLINPSNWFPYNMYQNNENSNA